MKKLALAFGILVSVSSVSMGAMSQEEGERAVRAVNDCFNDNKSACQALIDSGLFPSVGQCDKKSCGFVGKLYVRAGRYKEAIPYFEKAIALGDNKVYEMLGVTYYKLQDYYKAHEFCKKACDMKFSGGCVMLGASYHDGIGVRQNLSTAKQYYGKACDLGNQMGCDNYKEYNERGW